MECHKDQRVPERSGVVNARDKSQVGMEKAPRLSGFTLVGREASALLCIVQHAGFLSVPGERPG